MTKKMIKKALEMCSMHRISNSYCLACQNCPLSAEKNCLEILSSNALNLITAQETEIARLKTEQYLLLKEFAEKLKKKISTTTISGDEKIYFEKEYILPEAVDNLIEEMCK